VTLSPASSGAMQMAQPLGTLRRRGEKNAIGDFAGGSFSVSSSLSTSLSDFGFR